MGFILRKQCLLEYELPSGKFEANELVLELTILEKVNIVGFLLGIKLSGGFVL